MDINDLRSLFTVLVFGAFIGIVAWAYSSKRKQAFDEAARLAVDDEEPAAGGGAGQQHN
ncbi:MAG: cbb3-type cytochrome c oxidase subunit 3 [Rhodocyclaceae bacterium]|nr:cbb3-type cytochrome c oxidase subunit 3 [Rhodocyclaceae bacterium]